MKAYPAAPDGLLVDLDAERGTLVLTIDRVERRNALTDEIVLALVEAIEAAGSDEAVRVIHLTGAGDHFCSGFDLGSRGEPEVAPRAGATQRTMRWHVNRLIPTILETQTPVVVSARGWMIGLGLNIALAADFAVVAEDARLWAPFVGAGFTPDSGSSWLLPRLAGVARAKDMLMLDRRVSGLEAAEWGLVHQAVEARAVDTVARELVDRLAASPTVALGLTKLLVNRGLTVDLERHLVDEALAIELASHSEDFVEAGRAKREQRDPDFTGR